MAQSRDMDPLLPASLRRLLRDVGAVAAKAGLEAYVVGGTVRDVLLARMTTDIDFVAVGSGTGVLLAERVAAEFPGTAAHFYPNFGTASVHIDAAAYEGIAALEFVGSRKESYRRDSRKPIVEEGTLAEDLARRDFTVNAMAMDISPDRFGTLLDPFGGRTDLERRLLRTPLEPDQTFDDDPLRIIRAARFAAQLDFRIAPETMIAMAERSERIRIVSMERISYEFDRIMRSETPSVGFRALFECGILKYIFPELLELQGVDTVGGQRHKDNFFHTLAVLDNLVERTPDRSAEETLWLRWAALLHDIGKPKTKRFVRGSGWTFHSHEERGARMVPKIFRKLRLPTDERMRYVQKLIRLHHRPVALVDEDVTDSAVRRLLFDAGDEIEDLMTLVRADITSKNPRRVRRYLNAFDLVDEKMADVEEKDRLRNFQPQVDGIEIMETLGLKPGPLVGELKETIREAILEGRIPNEHEAAFEYLMSIKDDIMARAEEIEAGSR